MAFIIFAVCGFLGGILGGMGMGGGTALIPLLTIFCGVEQSVAQGMNLLSFLPMSLLALAIHAKNGLLVKDKLAWIVIPALVFSVLGSLCAAFLPARALRSGFGVFLIILSFTRFYAARKMQVKNKEKT
ncbi:MAG: sulfite exporter TauE/SafE family protein [Clostridia bacterium]|nr:sulfite exporter TauE/SafE family protein [Clostridia bacterium]